MRDVDFWILVLVAGLVTFFYGGEPDLHDALMAGLTDKPVEFYANIDEE